MITGVSHLMLRVGDFAASREVYVHRLGLQEIAFGVAPEGAQVCLVGIGAAALELWGDRSAPQEPGPAGTAWISHFALHMRDAYAVYRVLATRGIRWLGAPSDQPVGHQLIRRRLLEFHDPDRLMVQLAEIIDDTGKSRETQGAPSDPGEWRQALDGIDHIAMRVGDMGAKREFYKSKLGLPETAYRSTDWGEEASFALGSTIVELNWNPRLTRPPLHGGTVCGVAFLVDDVDETCRTLRQRGVKVSDPIEQSPLPGIQRRVSALQDPDGLPLQIVQPTQVG